MKKWNTKILITVSLLVALHVILSRFCSINAWNIKIGFAFVPVLAAACLYGPLAAGVVGGLGDFVGAILFPIGPYFPGFTLTCFLSGVVFGLFLHKKQSLPRLVGAVAVNELVMSLMLNSLWISILYGAPYLPLLGTRAIQCLVMSTVEFIVAELLMKVLQRQGREAFA